jgi:hypothetical protein
MLRPFGQICVYRYGRKGQLLKEGKLNMLSGDIHFLLRKQQYEDALQRAAEERLVRASQEVINEGKIHLRIAHWVGIQMIKWGSKLEQWDITPLGRVLTSTGGVNTHDVHNYGECVAGVQYKTQAVYHQTCSR